MPVNLTCKNCGKEYPQKKSLIWRSKFCSFSCRMASLINNNIVDLSGKRFGKWIVIEQSSQDSQGTRWLCRCECGTEKIIRRGALQQGHSKSCGCLGKFKPISPGARFERLTVEYELDERTHKYLCKCDCGNTRVVTAKNLRSGASKSCGCYSSDIIRKRNTTHGLTGTPEYMRWRRQTRLDSSSEWTLSMSQALFSLQTRCVVCGSNHKLSIDHVHPVSRGYKLLPGNAVVLCRSCNSKKNDRHLDQLPKDWQEAIETAAQQFLDFWNSR